MAHYNLEPVWGCLISENHRLGFNVTTLEPVRGCLISENHRLGFNITTLKPVRGCLISENHRLGFNITTLEPVWGCLITGQASSVLDSTVGLLSYSCHLSTASISTVFSVCVSISVCKTSPTNMLSSDEDIWNSLLSS